MEAAYKRGGGSGGFENNKEKLRGLFLSDVGKGGRAEHPAVFVESVGDFTKRVLQRQRKTSGGTTDGITYEFQGNKKLINKVGLTRDTSTGRIKLALGMEKSSGSNTKYVSNISGLCVFSIDKKNGNGNSLDILVGFYSENGKDWRGETLGEHEKGKSFILNEKNDKLVTGYEEWCERRAEGFNKEQNLMIGAPINTGDSKVEVSKRKINKISYSQSKSSPAFIGKALGGDEDPWYHRVCATHSGETNCDRRVWPVVLGVIGYKWFTNSNWFGDGKDIGKDFTEMVWGREDRAIMVNEWEARCKSNGDWGGKGDRCNGGMRKKDTGLDSVKGELTLKDQKVPLGVKFKDVKVI